LFIMSRIYGLPGLAHQRGRLPLMDAF
jgi:hypothetical protein